MSCLEFLDDVSSEVVDVGPVALDGIAKSFASVGSLVDGVLEGLVASEEGLKFVSIGIFVHAYAGGDEILGLEGAVGNHIEDVDDIVREAVGMVVAVLTVIVHFELTACHLGDAVVDGLAGVYGGLEVGVLEGQHGSAGLLGLVAGAHVDEDAKVHVGGHRDRLGQHGHTVA